MPLLQKDSGIFYSAFRAETCHPERQRAAKFWNAPDRSAAHHFPVTRMDILRRAPSLP